MNAAAVQGALSDIICAVLARHDGFW